MLIWLWSDIHLEMSVWDIPREQPKFDVLVVAGDLTTRAERGVRWLRERFSGTRLVANPRGYGRLRPGERWQNREFPASLSKSDYDQTGKRR